MTEKDKQKISDLIKQAKDGKQYAFTKLYEQFNKNIFLTIIKIVKNRDVADDLLSVTFTKAFSKINSYTEDISFEMWLKTIAINASIDYIRQYKKESNLYWLDDTENNTYPMQLNSSIEYSPEESFIFQETENRLSFALSRLRFKYRQILELRMANLSYKEIGEKLNLNESQVKTTLNKAREKLKKMLN